jgi:hypothetical protein
MRLLAFALVAVALTHAPNALARGHDSPKITLDSTCNPPSHLAPRVDSHDAKFLIDTEDGDASLILARDAVAMQLTDRAFHDVRRHLDDIEDEDDNVLAQSIKAVVLGSVRSLLDHSVECSIHDLHDIQYRHGRLVFITEDDDYVFENLNVNDRDVVESFSEKDAKEFIRQFRKLKGREAL